MKKIGLLKNSLLISLLIIILTFFTKTSAVLASPVSANLKGFKVNNLNYVIDKEVSHQEIKTNDNTYGSIGLWSAIYSSYNSEYDLMIYAILVVAEIQSNTFSDSIKRFVNRRIVLEVNFNNGNATLEAAYPNNSDYEGTYTISLSTMLGFENGVINGSIGFEIASTFKEIALIQTKNGNKITLDFDFTRYSVNSVTSKAPYRGLYSQKAMIFYSVPNFTQERMTGSEFSINYTGYIFKDHWLKNVTLNKTLNSTYVYNNSTQKFI